MRYTVNVRPHRKQKRNVNRLREIAEKEVPLRRHRAIMAGIEHRDEKLRALKANQMRADLQRLQANMASVPPTAVAAVEGVIQQLQRDLNDISRAAHRQRL